MSNEEIKKLRRVCYFYDVFYKDTGDEIPLDFEKSQVSQPTNIDGKDVVYMGDDVILDLAKVHLDNFIVCLPVSNPELD